MINPKVGHSIYNGLKPVIEGATQDPRTVPVVVNLVAVGGIGQEDIDLTTYVRQHKVPFIQTVFIDAAGLPANNYIDVIHPTTRHRVRCATPSQMYAPIFATEELKFTVRGTPDLIGIPFRIHFLNFEVGMSALSYAAAPMIGIF